MAQELELDDLIHRVFDNSPAEPNTIPLQFDTSHLTTTKEKVEYIFKQLLMIFESGMKILHGNESGKVDLSNLNASDLDRVKQHFQSFGFDFLCEIYPIGTNIPHIGGNINNSDDLSDYYLTLNSGDQSYILHFSTL